ncbi:peptidyl-prolyl cis-trans isomerase 11 [Aphelenchoides avenae]|nr:peptidyl-prolyl cis-trans isomerase 11 [Aphelenchus avenae]
MFLEMPAGVAPIGTTKMKLLAGVVLKTAKNLLGHKNSHFHRGIEVSMFQGGDFVNGGQTGMTSIYGPNFADGDHDVKLTGAGACPR